MSYDPSDPASGSPPPGGPSPPPPGYGPPPAYGQAPPPPPAYGQAPGSYAPGQQPSYPPPPPPEYGYAQPGGYGAPAQWGGPRLASWGQRVLALLVDAAATVALAIVVVILVAILQVVSDALGALVGVVGYVGVLAFQVWNQGVRQGQTGQSIGKQQMKLRVLGEETGRPTGAGLGFGRFLLHAVIGGFCFLDYLWPLWDAKRQTITDKLVKTVVVAE